MTEKQQAAATAINDKIGDFHGSDQFYRHAPLFPNMLFTQGVHFLAETADCFWLLDKISSNQIHKTLKAEEFQVWTLAVNHETNNAVLTATDGNGNKLHEEWLEFTDFPLPEISLWVEANGERGGAGRTILLPTEH